MPKPGVFLLYSTVMTHWGYIIRQPGATAAQTAYPLPPPTTVVGAFAAPLARNLGIPDSYQRARSRPVLTHLMECALHATLGASAGLLEGGVALVEEPSRIIGAPYKGGGSLNKALRNPVVVSAKELLPVQALGAASAPGSILVLSWLLDLERLEKCLETSISVSTLSRAAASVYRLGSREGIVTVVGGSPTTDIPAHGVIEGESLEELGGGGRIESILYQPFECVLPESGVSVASIVLMDEFYNEKEYLVPAGPGSGQGVIYPPLGPVRFRLVHERCKAYRPQQNLRDLAISFS